MMAAITLKPGREKSLKRRHPWVFSGAVAAVDGDPGLGDTVEVMAADGTWLARAAYSPASQIRARVWTFDPDESVDDAFFARRLAQAVARRRDGIPAQRLVHGESDGLPGVILDRYGEVLVCQLLSTGAEAWRQALTLHAVDLCGAATLYERSDAEVRLREGLEPRAGLLRGAEPPDLVEIAEGGCRYLVDVRTGQKTGFYLDQRDNRSAVAAAAPGRDVLDCFCYSGAFGVRALQAGARSVTQMDRSADALQLAERNFRLNGLDEARVVQREADVFHALRRCRDARESFDLIILDPPKFADAKHRVAAASRGYKDINLLAFKLLRPGGLLFTFSCSGAVSADLFQKIVAGAALDADCDARIVGRLNAAADHPTALPFPEGEYLKGLVCQVG